MKLYFTSWLVYLLILVSGCTTEVGRSLAVAPLPEPQIAAVDRSGSDQVRVKMGRFEDARKAQTIVVIDGRKVDSQGAVNKTVEEGFERYLRQAGARISVLNAPTIEGQVVDWSAEVRPGFPTSDASAVARLRVTVLDSRGHPIYYATFTGESTARHPMLGAEEVQRLLGEAMGSAIEAAVRDNEFIAQLSKGRIG
jgi:hypothetical protein